MNVLEGITVSVSLFVCLFVCLFVFQTLLTLLCTYQRLSLERGGGGDFVSDPFQTKFFPPSGGNWLVKDRNLPGSKIGPAINYLDWKHGSERVICVKVFPFANECLFQPIYH